MVLCNFLSFGILYISVSGLSLDYTSTLDKFISSLLAFNMTWECQILQGLFPDLCSRNLDCLFLILSVPFVSSLFISSLLTYSAQGILRNNLILFFKCGKTVQHPLLYKTYIEVKHCFFLAKSSCFLRVCLDFGRHRFLFQCAFGCMRKFSVACYNISQKNQIYVSISF